MNSLKLIITSLVFLSISATASTTTAPSKQYTEIKNNIYVSHLEKTRSSAVQERDMRAQKRDYMTFQRKLNSK